MKFNVIFISMAIGLLSHSVISAPVDNSNSNDVADNDNNVEVKPYHIDVPGADINIDENGVQVDKKPQDDDDNSSDNNTNDDMAAAASTTDDDPATSPEDNDDASNDPSILDKRSPLLGNMGTLAVTSEGIDAPEAGIHLGNSNNDLADEDLMGLTKRRLSGGLAATRDGVDVAPLGLHLGRGSDDPNMATASDSAQLKDVTDLFTKRDESNDDDGDDLKKQTSSTKKKGNDDEDLMTKREQDSQGPPPPGLSAEELDDFNTRKRDRITYSAYHHDASYGAGVPGGYPNRYISEDVADAMT